MNQIRDLITALAREFGLPAPAFTHWDFSKVSPVPACPEVARYFADSIPSSTIDLGNLRILSPEHLFRENDDLIPGCRVAPFGFITIAATDTGDSISVDVTDGLVYEISTDHYEREEISPGWKPDYSGFFDPIPITRENIIQVAKPPWPDIRTALVSQFVEE